jgi:hypothetical protein
MISAPNIKWAERKDKLFVTIQLDEVKDAKIDIIDEKVLFFSGTSAGKSYELSLDLFDEVVKADSKWTLDTRNIFMTLQKKNKGPYWHFINKDKKKYQYIHVDWALYVDEDEEDQLNQNDHNFGGNMGNFMNMGDMMGGMGGMGMDGMGDDIPDEDDTTGPKKEEDLDDLDKAEESK